MSLPQGVAEAPPGDRQEPGHRRNLPLARLTTLEIGGPAAWLAACGDQDAILDALAFARGRNLPVLVLGGGSNLVAADEGFAGLVLQVDDRSLEPLEEDDTGMLLRCGAGLEWDDVVAFAVAEGLGGLECLSGIPGRVGAVPVQNVGAYGQEVAETVERVHAVELRGGRHRSFTAAECGFAYRTSRFKTRARGRFAITAVDFRLPRRAAGAVRYPELARALALREGGPPPPLAAVREAVLALRRAKSMLLDPQDENRRSAGSFFLNPIVAPEDAARIERAAQALADAPPPLPRYPAPRGRVKLPAAWLIERAGFHKGFAMGRAGLSSRHVLAIVNRGGATAAELLALAAAIQARVQELFGVALVPEPVILAGTTAQAEMRGASPGAGV